MIAPQHKPFPPVRYVYRWSSQSRQIAAWHFDPTTGRYTTTRGSIVPAVGADTIRDRLVENLIRTGELKG